MLVLVRSFSYTPYAMFGEECLRSYTPQASFSEEFLLHSSGLVWWGGSLPLRILVLVKRFSATPEAMFGEEFLLHSWW